MVLSGIFYYLYNYPFFLATSYRIRASSEMVLAVIYMSVAMKMKPNLENAIAFTSTNLTGPLANDLKELIWGVYSGKYVSMELAIDSFAEKWKRENEEFTRAVNLIKTSLYEEQSERDKVLEEAVSVVLDGTKERMKHYSQELKTSLTILNALGILLPIIGLLFFPMITVFMPEVIKPIFIAIGYDIILPVCIFWLIKTTLMRRPATFHQPELEKYLEFRKKRINIELIVSVLLAVVIAGFGLHNIMTIQGIFSTALLMYSMLIIWGIAGGIVCYCFLSTMKKLKLRNEIVQMESELGVVLFQLGYQIKGGKSIENGIKKIKPKIKDLKLSKMFETILRNIQLFGMTFERAVFNEENGAIYHYPSRLISAMMKALVEISRSGMIILSQSMISISRYLKNMHAVEEYLRDMLSDVTSTMKTQALLLAPLTSGIVVALAAMMTSMLVTLKDWIESFQTQLGGYGDIGGTMFSSIININKIIPIHFFQIVVGIYMIEIVSMIAIFLSMIEFGEENLMRKYNLGKMLLMGTAIYSVAVILLYTLLTSIMPIKGLV